MAWFGGGLCGDRAIERLVETRYIIYLGIGVKNASNFGNPERFAKEKDAKYRVSTNWSKV
jgi:hypothetical protein